MATYDLWLFNTNSEADLTGELQLSFGDQAKKVRGIEKLVNIFVHLFLTEIGSDLVYNDIGTQLADIIGGNVKYNHSLFEGIILLSIDDVVATIKEDQDSNTPDDEFLLSVDLLEFSALFDTVSVKVQINSAAGESREIVIPSQFSL